MHLVRCGHFLSCYKDGSHTTGSAIPEKPMLHANLMALSFVELELWARATKLFITGIGFCGNRNFDRFAPVTLTLTL